MTHLYTCRHDGDQFRITKLTTDLDVVSSYLCSATECECPGFTSRNRCRHLEMLPRFMARPAALRGEFYYDFDRDLWISTGFPASTDDPQPHSPAATTTGFDPVDEGSIPSGVASDPAPKPFQRRF